MSCNFHLIAERNVFQALKESETGESQTENKNYFGPGTSEPACLLSIWKINIR